jgi:osmoprotectant transport system substrate-binding protein
LRGRCVQIVLAVLASLVVAALAGACGGGEGSDSGSGGGNPADVLPGEGKPAVTIGTKDFPEQFILGELYAQALEAQGYTVNLKKNIGPTEVVDDALTSGEIDAYPEYLGVSLTVVAGDLEPSRSAEETYERAREFYEGRGEAISEQTPFFNVDAIGTTREFAETNELRTVADLKRLDSFTLGARPEFENRFQGLRGMRQVYGLTNVEFVQLAQGITYEALDDGTVDTINVFSTDAQLASGKYVVLDDPRGVFGYQHVALVIDQAKLEELGGHEFMSIVDGVNALLTNREIIEMNQAVFLDRRPESDVAHEFLEARGLLAGEG